jgi:hypothetical protein
VASVCNCGSVEVSTVSPVPESMRNGFPFLVVLGFHL